MKKYINMERSVFALIMWISLMSAAFVCDAQSGIYNILDFGAKGDGKILNTEAINKAIVKCNREGGGIVLVPAGKYITGTIVLLSEVDLYLERGSILIGSKDTIDYLPMPNTMFGEGYRRFGMIYAFNGKNISITGEGEINGNGTFFMNGIDSPHMGNDFERKYTRQGENYMKAGTVMEDGPVSYDFRPGRMITIECCENVQIRDVYLTDSPEWTIRIGNCDNVMVSGITIKNNPLIPNNDGIHTATSRNITISDCNIVAGDDAIIVSGFDKEGDGAISYGNKFDMAENVTVTNCVLSSRSSCIRIGYGSHPIRNLVFTNLILYSSNRGIGIFSRDDSFIEKVRFSNIIIDTRLHSGHWWGKGEPIHISAIKSSSNGNPGKIDQIRFSDISATSGNGILIYGDKESPITDVVLNNVDLTVTKGKFTDSYGGNIDLRPAYPVNFGIFKADNPGLFAYNIKGLTINNFRLNWEKDMPEFFTNGIEIVNFKDVDIINYRGKPASEMEGLSAIKLMNGINAEIINSKSLDNSPLVVKENVK